MIVSDKNGRMRNIPNRNVYNHFLSYIPIIGFIFILLPFGLILWIAFIYILIEAIKFLRKHTK